MKAVRWLLVPVAAAAAWVAALVLGVILHDAATRLCPESQMVSGACVAPWWPYADGVVLVISAAVAAASIVIATAMTAPSHRPKVAKVVFALGAVWAVVLAVGGNAYLGLPPAALAGWGAIRWVDRRP